MLTGFLAQSAPLLKLCSAHKSSGSAMLADFLAQSVPPSRLCSEEKTLHKKLAGILSVEVSPTVHELCSSFRTTKTTKHH
jgi:hypothetical protein